MFVTLGGGVGLVTPGLDPGWGGWTYFNTVLEVSYARTVDLCEHGEFSTEAAECVLAAKTARDLRRVYRCPAFDEALPAWFYFEGREHAGHLFRPGPNIVQQSNERFRALSERGDDSDRGVTLALAALEHDLNG